MIVVKSHNDLPVIVGGSWQQLPEIYCVASLNPVLGSLPVTGNAEVISDVSKSLKSPQRKNFHL